MTIAHTLDNLLVHNYEWYDGSQLDKLLHELTKYLPRLEDETFHIYAQQHIDGDTIKDINSAIPAVIERLVKVQSILNHEGLGFPKFMASPETAASSFAHYHKSSDHQYSHSADSDADSNRYDSRGLDSPRHVEDDGYGGRHYSGLQRDGGPPGYGLDRRHRARGVSQSRYGLRAEQNRGGINGLRVPGDDLRSINMNGSLLHGLSGHLRRSLETCVDYANRIGEILPSHSSSKMSPHQGQQIVQQGLACIGAVSRVVHDVQRDALGFPECAADKIGLLSKSGISSLDTLVSIALSVSPSPLRYAATCSGFM
ncbi:hypothetical protein FOL47_006160 [Perkinsus chesapeaki]|uniref:Uncharacterized protein n=1 Tax=Perkinsus chesapeaki TaxID=330153 RepID=A0A7J6LUG7_PERCH|nr:hypothetical protein FOL47_006160 [Perkinsus chesapeaki]